MTTAVEPFHRAWWLPGPHAQTIGGRHLRPAHGVRPRRERLELVDGDFLDLDWVERAAGHDCAADAPLVLVLHGLEGSSRSEYVLEAERALARVGLASVALSFRSCSGEPNRLPRLYHSGETGDAAHVLDLLAARFPGRTLGAIGFSLGGNVLLKYLGERSRTPLAAAAAISVPYDLAAGLAKLETGTSRLYHGYLLRKLRRKVRAKAAILDELIDLPGLLRVRSLRTFDDLATAPLHGFRDAADYYRQSSSKQFVHAITIPTLLIHALDDPFLPAAAVPREEVADNPWLESAFVTHGGHVGFVDGSPFGPGYWAERTAAAFLAQELLG